MKTTVIEKPYEEVIALPKEKPFKPMKQRAFWRILMKILSSFDLMATHFKCEKIGMEKIKNDEPCLFLMNHSSFIDLEIVATLLYKRRYSIVATSDSFIGIMKWVMRLIGCIPTKKFMSDARLVRDMLYCIKELKSSVVMFPEASYSFDGTATPLPDSIGRCIKMLGVPVVMIRTYGAFARQPLYNGLRKRKVKVSAEEKCLLTAQQVAVMGVDDINKIIKEAFTFDNFRWQQTNKVRIKEKKRAEGLQRVLYKCSYCMREGDMVGEGTTITCRNCGKQYELTEYGYLKATDGKGYFGHIPDWYSWERACVRTEINEVMYCERIPVDICMMVNMKAIYHVGEGELEHSNLGFHLTGCNGQLDYYQKPTSSYSLYADYYWYEIGDVVCIGDSNALYYCFPLTKRGIVAKMRLAAEELYQRDKKYGEKNHK